MFFTIKRTLDNNLRKIWVQTKASNEILHKTLPKKPSTRAKLLGVFYIRFFCMCSNRLPALTLGPCFSRGMTTSCSGTLESTGAWRCYTFHPTTSGDRTSSSTTSQYKSLPVNKILISLKCIMKVYVWYSKLKLVENIYHYYKRVIKVHIAEYYMFANSAETLKYRRTDTKTLPET